MSAHAIWEALPDDYKQYATAYTDFWEAYAVAFPEKQLNQCGKEEGQTNHIERLNNTLRQRISRLVRKTLSFSKKLVNHIGAIYDFIHDYNRTIYTKIRKNYPAMLPQKQVAAA